MSVFNGARHLADAISSIVGQTFGDFEFLIADDKSSDSTREILEDMAKSDSRIRVFRNEENIGLTRSLNKLLDISKGEFVARIDADDLSWEERLERQMNLIKSDSLDFVTGCYRVVDEEGGVLYSMCPGRCDPSELRWSLVFRNNIRHSTAMWRNGGLRYDERFSYSQDYEMWCRMVRKGFSFGIACEIVSDIREGGESISAQFAQTQEEMAREVTCQQASHYLGRQLTHEEASRLRLVYFQKDQRQFDEFSRSTIVELKRATSLYLDVAEAFFNKERMDRDSMAPKIAADLNSMLCEPRRNSILVEIFKWNKDKDGEFSNLINEEFLKTREEDWKKREIKLI